MSPEQASGRIETIGPLSDVYSLGAVMYEILAGRPPFSAETPLHLMNKVRTEDPTPLGRLRAETPRDLQTVCFKALEKEPVRRYADMGAFADDLDRFLRGEPVEAKPPSGPERLKRWILRRKTGLVAASAAFLASFAVVLLLLSAGNRPAYTPAPPPAVVPAVSAQARREASFQMDVGRDFLRRAEKALLTENPANRRDLLEKALQAFEKACRADPERPEAFLEKGRALAQLERAQEALDAFGAALRLNPDLTDAYYGRGQIRYRMYFQSRFIGGYESSECLRDLIEADLSRIEEIGAKPEKVHTGRALLLMLDGKYDDALAELDKAVEADPSFPDAYGARGSVHMIRGLSSPGQLDRKHMREALKEFTEALKLSGGATQYRASRAQVLLALKQYKEALREADAVVEALPEKPYPYILRAQIRKFMGDEKGYDEDMDAADAMPVENLDMHIAMTGTLLGGLFQPGNLRNLRKKDVKRALKHIDALLEKNPDRTDLKGIRGLALTFLGKRKRAIADLEDYLEAYPDSKIAPFVQLALGMARSGLSVTADSFPLAYQEARQALEAGREKDAEALLRFALKAFDEGIEKEGEFGPLWKGFRRPASSACVDLAALLLRKPAASAPLPGSEALREEALGLLERAFTMRFEDRERLKGPDFASLADDPRFQALLGE
jgi:tetratricopeptide (TPR) repeat protein